MGKLDFSVAVLIGVINKKQSYKEVYENIKELEFLATTLNLKTKKIYIQKLFAPNPRTMIGKGKIEEIKQYCDKYKIGNIIFDNELSPSQQRNLENIYKTRILDRCTLILEIFEKNAKTKQAKTQIQLAKYQYILPRLTGMWTHLSRQKGGIGMKGAGEKEIETDRRIISNKITILKKELKKISNKLYQQRKNRYGVPRISIIGYTNAGKSTIMNILTNENLLAENKLFATLDTTVRRASIKNTTYLISDTVGFIRKLPHQLIESFKSTLEETLEADLLMHVVDISSKNFDKNIKTVSETLEQIGAININTIMVFNKIDHYTFDPNPDNFLNEEDLTDEMMFLRLKKKLTIKYKNRCVFISAKEKKGIDELRSLILKEVLKLAN